MAPPKKDYTCLSGRNSIQWMPAEGSVFDFQSTKLSMWPPERHNDGALHNPCALALKFLFWRGARTVDPDVRVESKGVRAMPEIVAWGSSVERR